MSVPAFGNGTLPVRVMVQDAWDELAVEAPRGSTVAELKAQALATARVRRDPAQYVIKFRGAELTDESLTLEAVGLVPNAALIVLPRRRRPVR